MTLSQFQGITAIILESETSVTGRPYDRVRIVMYDMHLYKDIVDDRDLTMIKRLSKDTETEIFDNRAKNSLTRDRWPL